jgi:hypothetical protein
VGGSGSFHPTPATRDAGGVPVARSARSTRSTVLAVTGLVLGIVLALGLFVVAIPQLSESGRIEVNLGDDRFESITADEATVREIAERGPYLLSDVSGGDRDVFVQHLGEDPTEGWLVFDARPPAAGRDCTLVWAQAEQHFAFPDAERCGGDTFPADGEGLKQYPTEVDDDDHLIVDLQFDQRPSTTTSTIAITGDDGGG